MRISKIHTLMDPEHLERELKELERMEAEIEVEAERIHEDVERILAYFRPVHGVDEPIMLDKTQVTDIITVLSSIDIHRNSHYVDTQFTKKTYLRLKQDRRWILGSKLGFLNR